MNASHAGALLLVFILPFTPGITAGLSTLIVLSLWWQHSHGLFAHERELSLNDGGILIQAINGEQRHYHVTCATAHTGFLCLTLARDGERNGILLLPRDAIAPEMYRNLLTRIVQKRLPAPNQELV